MRLLRLALALGLVLALFASLVPARTGGSGDQRIAAAAADVVPASVLPEDSHPGDPLAALLQPVVSGPSLIEPPVMTRWLRDAPRTAHRTLHRSPAPIRC